MPESSLPTGAARDLRKLTEAARALITTTSLDDIVRVGVNRAADLLGVSQIVLCLADEQGLLSVRGAIGVDEAVAGELRGIPLPETVERIERVLSVRSGQLVAAPLAMAGGVGGILAAVAADAAGDDARQREWLLAALGDHLAAAIEDSRVHQPGDDGGRRLGRAAESTGIGAWEYVPGAGRLLWDARCRALFNADPEAPDRYDAFLAAIHPEDRPQLHDRIQRSLHGSTDLFRVDCRPAHAGAEERWVMAAGRGLFDERAEPIGVIGTVIDVTGLRKEADGLREDADRFRRLSVELEVAGRTKDQFLVMLAHDLRTPLTAIGGWVRLLQSAKLSPEQAARALQVIGRNVKTQTRIVDDLLNVTAIAAGALRLHPIWCEAAAVFESAIDGVRAAADAKDIRIRVVIAPDGARMFADPQRLEQVLFHVLNNAVKFTGRCGQISITCGRAGSDLEIVVADNGEGIAPHLLPKVFDRPSQAEGSAGREHAGSGLGLAIVRHLVALHGGGVSVHSDGKGLGTTLTVRLPACAEPEASLPQASDTAVRRPA